MIRAAHDHDALGELGLSNEERALLESMAMQLRQTDGPRSALTLLILLQARILRQCWTGMSAERFRELRQWWRALVVSPVVERAAAEETMDESVFNMAHKEVRK